MKKIDSKKKVFYKVLLKKLCWKINELMKYIRDHMFCYYEVNMHAVRAKIDENNDKADKFDKVKERLPDIFEALKELKHCKEYSNMLDYKIRVLEDCLLRVYIADISGNKAAKKEIWDEIFRNKIINRRKNGKL